jgi:hypothetical protein
MGLESRGHCEEITARSFRWTFIPDEKTREMLAARGGEHLGWLRAVKG